MGMSCYTLLTLDVVSEAYTYHLDIESIDLNAF